MQDFHYIEGNYLPVPGISSYNEGGCLYLDNTIIIVNIGAVNYDKLVTGILYMSSNPIFFNSSFGYEIFYYSGVNYSKELNYKFPEFYWYLKLAIPYSI